MTFTGGIGGLPVAPPSRDCEPSGGGGGGSDGDTYPLLESICSPAPDTIRFEGQRFLTATTGPIGYVIPRLADYGTTLGGPTMIYELADGSPDSNGWSVVQHTDNILEISNPLFTSDEPSGGPGDFVVTGAAFHNVDTLGYYYLEPWGEAWSVPVDGAGCP